MGVAVSSRLCACWAKEEAVSTMLSKQEKTAQFLQELDTFLESLGSRDVINRGFMPVSYLGT